MNSLYNSFIISLKIGDSYVPFSSQERSTWSTADETLNEEENSKYTLTFQIPLQIIDTEQKFHPLRRYFYIGNYLKLEWNQQEIIFVISNISFDNCKDSIVYTITAQDEPSYKWSRLKVGFSYRTENDNGLLATKNIYQIAQDVLDRTGLSTVSGGQWSLPFKESDGNTDYDDCLDYEELHTQRITLELEDSNPYEVLIEACNTLNSYMKINHKQHRIDFYRRSNVQNSGYRYSTERNLISHSVDASGEELCTMLHVVGGEDVNGNVVGLVPPIPEGIKEYVKDMEANGPGVYPNPTILKPNTVITLTEPYRYIRANHLTSTCVSRNLNIFRSVYTLTTTGDGTWDQKEIELPQDSLYALHIFNGAKIQIISGTGYNSYALYAKDLITKYRYEPYIIPPNSTTTIYEQEFNHMLVLSSVELDPDNLKISVRATSNDGLNKMRAELCELQNETLYNYFTYYCVRSSASQPGLIYALYDGSPDDLEDLKSFEYAWHLSQIPPSEYYASDNITHQTRAYTERILDNNVNAQYKTYDLDYKYRYQINRESSYGFRPLVRDQDFMTSLYTTTLYDTTQQLSIIDDQVQFDLTDKRPYYGVYLPGLHPALSCRLTEPSRNIIFSVPIYQDVKILAATSNALGSYLTEGSDYEEIAHFSPSGTGWDMLTTPTTKYFISQKEIHPTFIIDGHNVTIYLCGQKYSTTLSTTKKYAAIIFRKAGSLNYINIGPVFASTLPFASFSDTAWDELRARATYQNSYGPVDYFLDSENKCQYYVLPYTLDAPSLSYLGLILAYPIQRTENDETEFKEQAAADLANFFAHTRKVPHLNNFLFDFSHFANYIPSDLLLELDDKSQQLCFKAIIHKVLLEQYYNATYDLTSARQRLLVLGDQYDALIADYATEKQEERKKDLLNEINAIIRNIQSEGQTYKNTCSIIGSDAENQLYFEADHTEDRYFSKLLSSALDELSKPSTNAFFLTHEQQQLEQQMVGRFDVKIRTILDSEEQYPVGSRVLLNNILDTIKGKTEYALRLKLDCIGAFVEEFINFIYNNFTPWLYESVYENTTELDSTSLLNQALQYFIEIAHVHEEHSLETIDIMSLENIDVPKLAVGNYISVINPHSLKITPYANILDSIYSKQMLYNLTHSNVVKQGLIQEQETLCLNYNQDKGYEPGTPSYIINFAQLEAELFEEQLRITSVSRVLREPLKDSITVEEPSRYKTILSKLIKSI